ncbi:MAG: 4'-phosphopantetheinyl transferase family protein [Salinispira sp.]
MYFLPSLTDCIPQSFIREFAARHGLAARSEAEYHHQFLRKKDHDNFFRRRIFLRRILDVHFRKNNFAPLGTNDTLAQGRRGKPKLIRADGSIYTGFNLSFTSDAVILAITEGDEIANEIGSEIGVDIESVHRELRPEAMDAILRYFFQDDERNYVYAAGSAQDRRRRFMTLWTRKEAVIKLLGEDMLSCTMELRCLNDVWLHTADGTEIRGTNFSIPGCPHLLACVALTHPVTEDDIQKTDARVFFKYPH